MFDHPVQLTLALFTGLLGFGGITMPGMEIVRILFFILIVLLVASGLRDRKRNAPSPRLQAWRQTRWTHYRN